MVERKVAWTAFAEGDLMRIVEFIAGDNAATAERVLEHLRARAASLADLPERGRKVPELRGTSADGQRELIMQPWRLFYVIEGSQVRVTALFDGRRDVTRLLRDRFAKSELRR